MGAYSDVLSNISILGGYMMIYADSIIITVVINCVMLWLSKVFTNIRFYETDADLACRTLRYTNSDAVFCWPDTIKKNRDI